VGYERFSTVGCRRACIADPDNDVLSTASAWEIITKVNIGKLILPEPSLNPIYSIWLPINESLPIQMNHVLQVSTPNHHRDPFDRILIARGQVEKMPILTADNLIAQYLVNLIW